jgi:outer membrane protein TolC
MRIKILLLFLVISQLSTAQKDIYLDTLISAAKQNWPAFKKQLSITGQKMNIDKVVNVNWYPKINISGLATYQSEVVTFPEVPNMPDFFPVLPKDNYNIEAGINQTLWDGGITKVTKELQHLENDIQQQELNVETYNLIGKIYRLYTGVLLLKENKKTINISINQLDSSINIMKAAVLNGVALSSELDNMNAEKFLLQKELIKLDANIDYTVKILNIITGLSLKGNDNFTIPDVSNVTFSERPELILLDTKIKAVKSQADIFKAKRFPKLFAFGKLGYGRPGYDFMNTELHTYYFVGAKFTWDVWDWNLLNKKKTDYSFTTQQIQETKNVTIKQLEIEQDKYKSETKRFNKEIEVDKQIVMLKNNVYKTAEAQLKNGVITTSEFLKIFNEFKRSKIALNIDKLKLLEAQLNYLHSKGLKY